MTSARASRSSSTSASSRPPRAWRRPEPLRWKAPARSDSSPLPTAASPGSGGSPSQAVISWPAGWPRATWPPSSTRRAAGPPPSREENERGEDQRHEAAGRDGQETGGEERRQGEGGAGE